MIPIVFVIYGVFLLSGAYFGLKAGSKVSLYMGIATGILTFVGVYLIRIKPQLGYMFLAELTGILSVVFLIRLKKTKKFMPAGMLMSVSMIMLILAALQLTN